MNKSLAIFLESLKTGETPGIDECVKHLGEHLPLLLELEKTEQDPEWHAEGNVYIHTGMVLDELYILLERDAPHLGGEARQALVLAALLHDIGKPVCTKRREINDVDRVVSPGHEGHGRSYLAYKLMGIGLSYFVIRTVLGLVGEHHMPKLLVVRDKPIGDYLSLARRAECELLYYLELADMSGRHCPDKSKQLEYLELFKLFCQEYQVWRPEKAPYYPGYLDWRVHFLRELSDFDADTIDLIYGNAVRDRENGLISTAPEAIARSFQYRDSFPRLVVMCGPSGSGKTRWIQNHLSGYAVVSLDDIREEICGNRTNQKMRGQVMQEAKSQLKHHLRSKNHVVWDATNLRKDFRAQICALGFSYQALVTLVIFQQEEAAYFEGNENRAHSIPKDILQRQIDSLQWPTVDEAHRALTVGKGLTYHYEGTLQEKGFSF